MKQRAKMVFTTGFKIPGSICPRIPDSETGERNYWIRWRRETFASNPGLELAAINPSITLIEARIDRTLFNLKNLEFAALGYPDLLRIHRELCGSRDDIGECAALTERLPSSILNPPRH